MNASETIKVGDVVAFPHVPDGALVRARWPRNTTCYALRINGHGCWVGADGEWSSFSPDWPWRDHADCVTVIALGRTGKESADALRRIAEAP